MEKIKPKVNDSLEWFGVTAEEVERKEKYTTSKDEINLIINDIKESNMKSIKQTCDFYNLIDRLKEHSEWKYPKRKTWDAHVYDTIAFAWMGKLDELKNLVAKHESNEHYKAYLKSKINQR